MQPTKADVPQDGGEDASGFRQLDVRELSVWFDTPQGPLVAVDRVSFSIRRGEHLGLIGESGSGKSVTALATLGFERGTPGIVSGRIQLDGQDVLPCLDHIYPRGQTQQARIDAKRRLRRPWAREISRRMGDVRGMRIGISFQEPSLMLDPVYTVGRHLHEALVVGIRGGADGGDLRQQSLEWLRRLQLSDPASVLRAYPHQLSGGMCQRVVLAMALASKPGLLILDEPTAALDVTVGSRILLLLRELCDEEGLTLLVISHDLAVVRELVSHVAVMYAGQIIERTHFVPDADGRARLLSRHPYTRALLDSQITETLIAGDGTLPQMSREFVEADRDTAGCRFAARCQTLRSNLDRGYKVPASRCVNEMPALLPPPDTSLGVDAVRCWDPTTEGIDSE
ncbi:ABC transporter ATP-binding protein [Candidatus Poribacteria bacterium]|jgi:ABC-type dipeptide/oligopeptide/nickel transport system ATPase component|nr:ABC transporter ATP-binding protein [Candidatus Poribacteria bacterium]MBT7807971.1 ABC transporter ATP-binding protein [Candidatus Poribacteria bacterium]